MKFFQNMRQIILVVLFIVVAFGLMKLIGLVMWSIFKFIFPILLITWFIVYLYRKHQFSRY